MAASIATWPPTLMVCRPSSAGRFGRGTEVGDATMIYSVKVLLLRPAQPEPEFSIGIDARPRLASKVRLWCVYGTLGCARAIVHELSRIGRMDGGKALHRGMRGHSREPTPAAFGPITRAPKLRSSAIAR
jgi:hypothetical protein